MQAQIDAAIRDGQPLVKLPAGTVRLAKGLRIQDAKGITVDGTGTTLVVADYKGYGVDFIRCRDVALKGLTLDFDPLPFTQGTIAARAPDKSWAEFDIHEGYPDLTEEYLVRYAHIFDRDQVRWKPDVPVVYTRRTLALTKRRGRVEVRRENGFLDHVEAGDRIVLNMRTGFAIRFLQCENVRVEGVTVLTAPGCGVIARYMKGDNRFQYDIRPGPTPKGASQPRLMSTCADGFNFACARRGPVLEDSHFSFMGDDSVNIHGPTFLVVGVPGPTELLIAVPYGPDPIPWLVEPGDAARGLHADNYAIIGQAPTASIQCETNPAPALLEKVHAFWPRLKAGSGAVYRLALRAPLNVAPGDALDIPAVSAPQFRISNCEFKDFAGQMRLLSSHGIVENNLMVRTGGIQMEPHYAFWREAGWVEDVIVRNNRLVDTGRRPEAYSPWRSELGAISVSARKEDPKSPNPFFNGNRHIVIENNTIDGCPVAGIYVRCASDVTVRGNAVSHTNYVSAPDAGSEAGFDVKDPIDVRGVPEVTVTGNRITDVGAPPND